MSSNFYSVGLNHVGAYQVSGRPFFETQAIPATTGDSIRIQFPSVTKRIVIKTDSAASVRIHFVPWTPGDAAFPEYTEGASTNDNYFLADRNMPIEFEIKCKEVFISANFNGTGEIATVFAELTNIPANRMFNLEGLEGVSQ